MMLSAYMETIAPEAVSTGSRRRRGYPEQESAHSARGAPTDGSPGRAATLTWSTRQLADLAGTSLRTVRHYHDTGLLTVPERSTNGYKHYGVRHLVRLLQIRRLTDLGFSLAQVAEMGRDGSSPAATSSTLDTQLAELTQSIERLRAARTDLVALLEQPTPDLTLPAALAPLNSRPLTEPDRAFLITATRVLSPCSLATFVEMVSAAYDSTAFAQLDRLQPDADEETRSAMADRLAHPVRCLRAAYPPMDELIADALVGPQCARQVLGGALRELYSSAQVDVLHRLDQLLADEKRPATSPRSMSGQGQARAAARSQPPGPDIPRPLRVAPPVFEWYRSAPGRRGVAGARPCARPVA